MKTFIRVLALVLFIGLLSPADAAYTPLTNPTDTVAGPTNITTQNLVPAGTATAASAVELACNNKAGATVQVTGTYTGALSLQGTVDGSTWVTSANGNTFTAYNNVSPTATIASASQNIFKVSCDGLKKIRVTALAAVTGTAAVTINATGSPTMVGINATPPSTAVTGSLTSVGTVTTVSTVTGATTVSGSLATPIPLVAQGSSTYHHLISAASTNATSVKGTASVINSIVVSNTNAAVRFFKLYNKATAPTVGTDIPILTLAIPPGQTIVYSCAPFGCRVATGLAYALTTGIADADTGAVGTDMSVMISYT